MRTFAGVFLVSLAIIAAASGLAPRVHAVGLLTMSLDCDTATPGIQDTCSIAAHAATLDVAIVLTNSRDTDFDFSGFSIDVLNPDNSRLKARPVIATVPGYDGNPEFNFADFGGYGGGGFVCSPFSRADTGHAGPTANDSYIYCITSQTAPPAPLMRPGDVIKIATVHYDAAAVAPLPLPGSVALSFWVETYNSVEDTSRVQQGYCPPLVITLAMTCNGATINLIGDTDGDGFDDVQSTSGQGPANTSLAADNCPGVANASQLNTDGNFVDNSPPYAMTVDDKTLAMSDGLGNACDADDDNDGLTDTAETSGPPCASASGPTDPLKSDSDGDRVSDGAECALGSDPANAASKPAPPAPGTDSDGDGLSNALEASIGSNPNAKDTDGDGLQDGWEYKTYNTSLTSIDSDGDGTTDGCEVASLNADKAVNPGDQALLSAELMRAVPASQKLPNFDLNPDGALNPGDQAFQSSRALPGRCPP